jgi:hypothetical protein
MGGGPEYLLRVPLGARLLIKRWGRLYGAPETLAIVVDDNGRVVVEDLAASSASAEAAAKWGES